jgi:hypothetical protein
MAHKMQCVQLKVKKFIVLQATFRLQALSIKYLENKTLTIYLLKP